MYVQYAYYVKVLLLEAQMNQLMISIVLLIVLMSSVHGEVTICVDSLSMHSSLSSFQATLIFLFQTLMLMHCSARHVYFIYLFCICS